MNLYKLTLNFKIKLKNSVHTKEIDITNLKIMNKKLTCHFESISLNHTIIYNTDENDKLYSCITRSHRITQVKNINKGVVV